MRVIWLAPLAWIGALAIAVPVLIHLLTNRRARHVLFPSLRFLRHTRLAALRRRRVEDWLLLALRVAIVSAAVAALAAPVFLSAARESEWRRRVARAVVIAPGSTDGRVTRAAEAEREASFTSWVFGPTRRVADGVRDAALWLREQHAGSHEIVIVGDLTLGSIAPDDLAMVPRHVGVRFLPLPKGEAYATELFFREGDSRWRAAVALTTSGTRVTYHSAADATVPLSVRAAPADKELADAALAAVMARGIDLPSQPDRQVIVMFDGAPADGLGGRPLERAWMRTALAGLPGVTATASGDTLVIAAPRPASVLDAAHFLQRAATVAFAEDRRALEPAPIPAQTLARWSRPAGEFREYRIQAEGDRRWLWGAVLVLMVVETIVSRRRVPADESTETVETRVA